MASRDERWRAWGRAVGERATVYGSHVLGILAPGREVRLHRSGSSSATGPETDLSSWAPEDLDLIIEQGRIQLARQRQDLENVRGRAQFLFTTTLAILTFAIAGLVPFIVSIGTFMLWALGIGAVLCALVGAAGVIVANKNLGEINTAFLPLQTESLRPVLAGAYANSVSLGETTLSTEITVFRDAVFMLILGTMVLGAGWAIAILIATP